MTRRRALVTGASGFIGSHVVEALLESGWTVRCLVRQHSSRAWLEPLEVEYAPGDVTRDLGLEAACSDCTCVVHCAGVTNAVHQRKFFEVNRDGTRRLRDAAVNAGVSRFVFLSSLAARGPRRDPSARHPATTHQPCAPESIEASFPVNAYGRSKLEAEQSLLWSDNPMATVIVRAPAVYGPRDRDVLTLVRMTLRGFFTMVHGGHQRLSMVHVSDLANGIRLACEHHEAHGHFTFTDGHDHELADLGLALARALGSEVRLIPVPNPILWLGAAAGEAWGRLSGHAATINFARLKHFRGADWTVCGAGSRTALGFEPRFDLEHGLADTVAWYQRVGWI